MLAKFLVRAVFAALGGMPESQEADEFLAEWLDQYAAGTVPATVQLDVLDAAKERFGLDIHCSEGLLGVVTEVTVRLLRKPATARAVLLGLDRKSVV